MDDKSLLMTLFIDFFGELLTDKQREYLDLYHNEDLSLSEIAERSGISRQGVHDTITRAKKMLHEFEGKTGIVRRWLAMQVELERVSTLADELSELCAGKDTAVLAGQLASALNSLAGKHSEAH